MLKSPRKPRTNAAVDAPLMALYAATDGLPSMVATNLYQRMRVGRLVIDGSDLSSMTPCTIVANLDTDSKMT